MGDEKKRVPEQAVKALRRALGDRLVAVVLFGSRARGDARPDSDWDLLVIAEQLPEGYWDRHRSIREALRDGRCAGVSVVAKTPTEFESYLAPLYLDIALDGQLLFDRNGYARGKLNELRRIIQRAGLFRERTEAGDIWRWKQEPARPWAVNWEGHGATD
ncbi:MAG: nucleotidyltransferase domain-containing protein [Candidatus Binatia bacterium]